MKQLFWLLTLLGLAMSFGFQEDAKNPGEPFAIVELFTSEGCSSCPAADELLEEMTTILQKEGKNVLGLSFHVTYWDRLGWQDPYSAEIFTERQKKYMQILGLGNYYTPQAVVNGQAEFIGSNPFKFRELVTAATSNVSPIKIEGQAGMGNGQVNIHYESSKETGNAVMNVALVENSVQKFVERGENKSRTLKHFNVVRVFSTEALKLNGDITLAWPEGLQAEKASIILYAQNAKTYKIIGAVKLPIK